MRSFTIAESRPFTKLLQISRNLFLTALLFLSWASYAQTQASGITIEPVPTASNSLKFNWSSGTGTAGRLVIIRDASSTFTPTSGVNIGSLGTIGANYGTSTDLDATANVAKGVYTVSGAGATVTVSNLPSNTRYTIQVYEFTGSSASPTYLPPTNLSNPLSFQFFTASGTFNVPSGITSVSVQALGGGGGGGGADGNTAEARAGGGGAGGSYTLNSNTTVTPGAAITVTVGAGGIAGLGGNSFTNGGTGGTTTFGGSVSAVGGVGGFAGVDTNETGAGAGATTGTTQNGGAGSEAPPTGGDGNNATGSGAGGGSAGTTGPGTDASGTTQGSGGSGGGGAGAAGITGLGNPGHSSGNSASQYGGGGSGGWDNFEDVQSDGGTGAPGYAIVSWSPLTSATAISPVSNSTTSIVIPWVNGSGAGRLVLLKRTTDPAFVLPATNATPNTAYSGTGTQCIWNSATNGAGTSVTVTGLVAGTTSYIFQVFEYNGSTYQLTSHSPVTFTYYTASASWTRNSIKGVLAQVWGGGGGGGAAHNNDERGGGGAGGAYAQKIVPVASATHTVTVSGVTAGDANDGNTGGDSWFDANTTVIAKGGVGGQENNGSGGGGTTTGSIGDQVYGGGDGNTGVSAGNTGGGGESGGPAGNGNSATNNSGASGNVGAGAGGTAATSGDADGGNGFRPGGGGAGARSNNTGNDDRDGGDGAAGFAIISHSQPVGEITYTNTSDVAFTNATFKDGSVVRIRVTLSEPIKDAPVLQFSLSGAGTSVTNQNMVKTSATSYYYDYTVNGTDAAVNTATVSLGIGESALLSNLVTGTPISGATFTIDNVPPQITSITRQNPTTTPTNADALNWDVQFDGPVVNVDAADFNIAGTTATVTGVNDQGGNVFRITVSGGDLAGLETTVTLTLKSSGSGQDVSDAAGNVVSNLTPTGTNNNTFLVDNTGPTSVTVDQGASQLDPELADATVDFKVVFNEAITPGTFTNADFTLGGTATYTLGAPAQIAPNDGTTWNVTATVTVAGTLTPSTNTNLVSDVAGNVGGNNASTAATDGQVTVVFQPTTAGSISFPAPNITPSSLRVTRTGGDGQSYLLVARATSAVDFVPVDGTDYTASVNSNFGAAANAPNGTNCKILALVSSATTNYDITGLAFGTTYHFALFAVNGSGTSSNFLTTAATGSQATTNCTLPAAPTNLNSITANTSKITINFDRAAATDGYLVLLKQAGTAPTTSPVDGADYSTTDNLDFTLAGTLGDGKIMFAGDPDNDLTPTVTVSGLTASTTYSFAIYTFDATSFCYKTGVANTDYLTGTQATGNTYDPELAISAGAATEPNTISSVGTVIAPTAPGPGQATAVQNLDFTITDSGLSAATASESDGADGLISQIVIKQGSFNQIGNWVNSIASAQLSDGTNTLVVSGASITTAPNTIVFGAIPTGSGQLGRILDGGSKTYTLTIALRNPLVGGLPTTIDGLRFDFDVNTTATSSFTTGASSSTFAAGGTSSGTGKNVVDVTATKIEVGTQPSTTPIADVDLVQQPVFHARDFNNNRDLGYGNAITAVNTSPNLGATYSPTSFSSGVATFTDLKFANVATSTMTVSTATPLTSAATSSIAVSASTALTSATGTYIAADPIFNNATNQVVLGFSLQTTGSLLNLTALTFTSSVSITDRVKNIRLFTNGTTNDITDFSSPLASPTSITLGGTSIQFTGLSSALDNTAKYFFLVVDVEGGFPDTQQIQFSLATSGITVSKGSKTGGPVSGTNYNLADNTPPTLVEIIPDSTTFNAWGFADQFGVSTPAYHSNQASFIFTFSEPVVNVDGTEIPTAYAPSYPTSPALAFSINSFNPIDNTGAPSTSPSKYWKLTYDVTAGAGLIAPYYMNSVGLGSVQDVNGNQETTFSPVSGQSIGSDPRYIMAVSLAKPGNTPAFNTSTADVSSITLSWDHNVSGQAASGYYIRAKENGLSFQVASNPVNGTQPMDGDASDGFVSYYVTSNSSAPSASQTLQCTGLKSGVSYDFEIIPYVNVPDIDNGIGVDTLSIEFNPANSATTTFSTTTAKSGSMVVNSTPTPISSILDGTPVTDKADVMNFTIKDDGSSFPPVITVMSLATNGAAEEAITFRVKGDLTLANNASVTGFTSSTGSVLKAVYHSKGINNYITLVSAANGTWTTATTISYSGGNVNFVLSGPMQSFTAHPVIGVTTFSSGTFTTSGTYNPAGPVIVVQAWGGGGSGGALNTSVNMNGGSGGGGGAYSRSVLAVVPGNSINYTIGAGGTPATFDGSPGGTTTFGANLVRAVGGGNGWASDIYTTVGAGGSSGSGIGDVRFSGGSGGQGGAGSAAFGGGGGSSAGTAANGNPGGTGVGGGAPAGGGSGGAGVQVGNGVNGGAPGGGSGGTGAAASSGAGGSGQITIFYSNPSTSPNTFFATDGDDTAPFKFDQLIITQGPGNDFTDWRTVLAGAEITDGSTTVPGVIDIVNGDKITFTQTSSAPGNFGYIPDATPATTQSKTYTLRVWLNNNMGGLATTLDNQNLSFQLKPTDVILNTANNQKSSELLVIQPTLQSGVEQIQVNATELEFVNNPPTTALVLTNLSATPQIQARDANNNVDRDYNSSLTVTSPAVALVSSSSIASSGNGVYNFPAGFQFTDQGSFTLQLSGPNTATSPSINSFPAISPVTTVVSYSSASTITAGSLNNLIINSTSTTLGTRQNVFDFVVVDDGGVGLGDGAPTRIDQIIINQGPTDVNTITNWLDVIQGARLTDNLGNFMDALPANITNTSITFTSIPNTNAATHLGHVADAATASKTYTLSIYLKPATAIPTTLDGKKLTFNVNNTVASSFQTITASSKFAATQSRSTTLAQNIIQVCGTELRFIAGRNLGNPTLAMKDISLQQATPQLEVTDVNGNRDTGFNSASVSVASGSILMNPGGTNPINISAISGFIDFPANFQYQTTGTGTLTISTTIGCSGLTPSIVSNVITVQAGQATEIVAGAAASATVPSLATTSGTAVNVLNFNVIDDLNPIPANNDDGLPTLISKISFTRGSNNQITRWDEAIAGAELWSGATNQTTGVTIKADSIVFTGISTTPTTGLGYVQDGTTKPYTLKIYLKANMAGTQNYPINIDGLQFDFRIHEDNVVLAANSTRIVDNQTQQSGPAKDVVDVASTNVVFTSQPPASISTFATFSSPGIIVEARDINGNRDRNYNGAIGAVTNNGTTGTGPSNSLLMSVTAGGSPTGTPTGNFVNGVYAFLPTLAPNFMFVEDSGPTSPANLIQLTVNAAGLTAGVSSSFSVSAAYDSYMYFDPTPIFAPSTLIDFVTAANQGATPTASSQTIGTVILSDGGGPISTYPGSNAGSKDRTISHTDSDGAFTKINGFTVSLTNFGDVEALRLFQSDGTTPITAAIPVTSSTVPFTGLSGYPANDGSIMTFVVKATFKPTISIDRAKLDMQIINVSWNSGSQFAEQLPAYSATHKGGILGGDVDPDGPAASPLNRLDVIATQLDFTTQPSPFAGIDEPIGNKKVPSVGPFATPPLTATTAGEVRARDKFANLDLQFNYTPTDIFQTTGHTTVNNIPNFKSGILKLDSIAYTTAGVGTLTVEAGGLSSATGASIGCSPVNVIHVTASYPTGDATIIQGSGSPPTYSIKGGSVQQVIFGVKFNVDGETGTEPDLKNFSIVFDKSFRKVVGPTTTNIFENFIVKERDPANPTVLNDVTGVIVDGSLVYNSTIPTDDPGSLNKITVNLKGNPRPITDGLTYYLYADVNSSASISTPDLTPTLSDLGYSSLSSDTTILTSYGTAISTDGATSPSTIVGNKYTFASTRPPKLLTGKNRGTSPYPGQLNVDSTTTQIKLAFDVKVNSLDGGSVNGNNGAELFRRYDNVKVADLVTVSGAGNYPDTHDYHNVVNPLTYNINFIGGNSFKPDTVYYVKVKKGSFDPIGLTGTGISDEGLNFYGGIQDNATLYFKIASKKPIKLQGISSPFMNTKIVSLSTNFDQFGTAYYIVAPSPSSVPSIAQMKSPASYLAKVASGKYDITQINTLQTETFQTTVNLTTGSNYDIYVYAENDAPTPISAGGVFGTSLAAGSGGPTLTVKATNLSSYAPAFSICPSSFVDLNDPIILGESTVNEFKKTGSQDLNILLPNGYEFDRSVDPIIQLVGSDFQNPATPFIDTATFRYFSNSILNIDYKNNPAISISLDYIVISNLRVKAAANSAQLPIRRFYGDNTFTPSVATVATIGLKATTPFGFTNSYSIANPNFPPPSPLIVNAIPDNYVDQDLTILGSIRLFPRITVKNDYNSSTFSGSGVTGELLTLNAVPSDVAFDVSMKHTDPNGCILEKTEQYLVYDHIAPISVKLGNSYVGDPDPNKAALAGTTQAIVNTNFNVNTASGTSGPISSPTLLFNEKAGFKLESLSADLPETEKRLNLGGRKSQIISGLYWRSAVQSMVSAPMVVPDPPFGTYNQYTWDYARILNAKTEQGSPVSADSVTTNPYNGDPKLGKIFQQKTSSGKTYWTGGSLGNVEYTAVFRSIADLSVVLPFRQNVELFVPPVPVIEINTVATDTLLIPDYPIVGASTPTLLFCEYGGAINITGFPNASAVSKGKFTLSNLDGSAIAENGVNYTGSGNDEGFKDNGNGTAILYPFKIVGVGPNSNKGIINNYNDIKITYTFQENNSPAQGSGWIIVRITPNPKANFDINSLVATNGTNDLNSIPDPKGGAAALTVNSLSVGRPIQRKSYCEDSWIYFDNKPSWPASVTGATISKATWDFGDNTPVGSNTTRDAHVYASYGRYDVSLSIQSQYGCASLDSVNSTPTNPIIGPTTKTIYIGAIPLLDQSNPNADISMKGISTATTVNVRRTNLGLPSGATGTNYPVSDTLTSLWHFGEPFVAIPDPALSTAFIATNNHLYDDSVGHYKLTLLQRTRIQPTAALVYNPGCERSVQRDVIIVPAEPVQAVGVPYLNPLTTAPLLKKVAWQVDDGLMDANTSKPVQSSTWRWGDPNTAGYPILPSNSGGPEGWFTGNGGSYKEGEKSYLFTSAYNFANMSRPMLSFDQHTQTLQNDGVALDFSIDDLNVADPKKVWYRLGKQGEGSDWYNKAGLASKPGAQTEYPSTNSSLDFGWSETLGAGGAAAWVNSRLSITPAIPINKPIIFRFTLAVNSDSAKIVNNAALAKGIAIDNFRFGERTRIVLVENFTNAAKSGGMEKQEADNLICDFCGGSDPALKAGVDYVKLNYHVGFPKPDPFNLLNGADPSARALFYGISSTPKAEMDGIDFSTTAQPLLSGWGRSGFNNRTLDLSPAEIIVNFLDSVNAEGALKIDVAVKAIEPLTDKTYLHIVVVEKGLVTQTVPAPNSGEIQFEYVVRKMLPSASGTKFKTGLNALQTMQFDSVVWIPDVLLKPKSATNLKSNLAVIIFVQDEVSKKILQAKMVDIGEPTNKITGIENPFNFDEIGIYPNPADHELNIVFPNKLEMDVPIVMFDQMGRITHNQVARKGEESVTLQTQSISAGMYILQIDIGQGKVGRSKIIVHHKE